MMKHQIMTPNDEAPNDEHQIMETLNDASNNEDEKQTTDDDDCHFINQRQDINTRNWSI